MTYPKEELINYRLRRSRETFSSANLLFENGYLNESISRLYYACFYAVLALFLKNNIKSSSHVGVRKLFGLHFIKTGILKKEDGQLYSLLFDQRQKSDYEDFVKIAAENVKNLIDRVKAFIDDIEAQILN